MKPLLYYWQRAFLLALPQNLFALAKQAIITWAGAVKVFVTYFAWLLLVDLGLFALIGNNIIHLIKQPSDIANLSHIALLLQFVLSIVWFVLRAGFLLFLRMESMPAGSVAGYFKRYFFRYIQFSLLLSLLMLVSLSVLISLGITQIPSLHWMLLLALSVLQFLGIFFWLDSGFTIKDFFRAIESGLNFFVYNLPIFLIFFLLLYGVSFFLSNIFPSLFVVLSNYVNVASNTVAAKEISVPLFMVFKYLRFFVEFLLISMLYVIYQRRKNIPYTKSIFRA